MDWSQLKFWDSGEWQVIEDAMKKPHHPSKKDMFNAMKLTAFDDVRVCIVGQDPYPEAKLATGVAFSVPKDIKRLPPTLMNILHEYNQDLHLPYPDNGNLEKWCSQGVLLWNAIPMFVKGKPLAYADEWSYLTKEIFEKLSDTGTVFALLGQFARQQKQYILEDKCSIIETSHPSPRGQLNARKPFIGSRLFSTINVKLCESGHTPIDWSLT